MKNFIILILILCFASCGSDSYFEEDFESYVIGDSTGYRIYPENKHDDVVLFLNDSQVYRVSGGGVYQFYIDPISSVSFDLMVSSISSVNYIVVNHCVLQIRQDLTVVSGELVGALLLGVWHTVNIRMNQDKLEWGLDGSVAVVQCDSVNAPDFGLLFITKKADIYVDNFVIHGGG